MIRVITGDLIELAEQGQFDVIAHGCNCFCRMKRGLAVSMAEKFGCDKYPMEDPTLMGNINKLGNIDFKSFEKGYHITTTLAAPLTVVNMYTQFH